MAEIDLMKKSSTDETVARKREPTAKDLILVTPHKNKNNKNNKK